MEVADGLKEEITGERRPWRAPHGCVENFFFWSYLRASTARGHTVAIPLRESRRALMAQTGDSGPVVVDGESFLDALFASAGQG